MKKLMAFILALLLTASLAACGGAAVTGGENGSATSAKAPADASSAPDISLSGTIEGEITVSCYDTMKSKAFLEDAARLFEEKYPGTNVNVETFSAMPEIKSSGSGDNQMVSVRMEDDPQGRQDYINKVSTSLMSGDGADILAMDVLPVQKYIESGHLENLAPYMSGDESFNRADYRENVLDAVEYKNGTWFMPMNYSFDYYAYDTTLLTDSTVFGMGKSYTAEDLIGLAEVSYDGSSKLFSVADYLKGPGGGMWNRLLNEHYSSFVDLENKEANFNDGGFAALLETVKKYGEQGYIPKGATGQKDAGGMMRRAGEEPSERVYFKPKSIFNLLSMFTRNLGMRMTIMAEGDIMAIGDDDEVAGVAANSDGSVPFTFDQAYAVNANSKNKETAWAFLKFLLTEEMQLNTNLMPTALPIQNTARAKRAENMLTGASGRQAVELTDEHKEAIAGYNEAVEQLSGSINAYVLKDSTINDMISAEVQYFFEGTKTAAEVAQVLQNKVGLYLSE